MKENEYLNEHFVKRMKNEIKMLNRIKTTG